MLARKGSMKRNEVDQFAERVAGKLGMIFKALSLGLKKRLFSMKIGPPHMKVLFLLCSLEKEPTISKISRSLSISLAMMTRIIDRLEEKKLGYKRGRFGWFECVDDPKAAATLLGYLEDWFVKEGCREFTGPHGFSDLDPEGLLIDGFEALPTIAGSYNKPYYSRLIENLGFEKEIDYIENRIEFPADNPLFKRMEKRVAAAESDGYRVVKLHKKKEILKTFWREILL